MHENLFLSGQEVGETYTRMLDFNNHCRISEFMNISYNYFFVIL